MEEPQYTIARPNPENEDKYIIFCAGEQEVLKFKKDKVWVYGKEVPTEDCTKEVIDAFIYFTNYLTGKDKSNLSQLQISRLEEKNLTKRELQIVSLLSTGVSNLEISEELGLTEKTVKYYLTRIFRKVEVKDRNRLLVAIHNLGFL